MAKDKRIDIDPAEVFEHVLVVIPSRHTICGYEPHKDCVGDLTRRDIVAFKRRYILEAEPHEDLQVRSLDVGKKRIFGIWGCPRDVATKIQFGLKVSSRSVNQVCLFVIGACWIDD